MLRTQERMIESCALALLLTLSACGGDTTTASNDTRSSDVEDEDDDSESDEDQASDDDSTATRKDAGKSSSGKKDAGKTDDESAAQNGEKPSGRDAGASTTKDAGAGTTDTSSIPTPKFFDGPADGDPSKPVVAISEVACGGSKGGLDALAGGALGGVPVPGAANLKIGGRDVILTYPCNKHEGAPVTFILNLHGTMPSEDLKFYQHGYFAAHKLANSHNLIIATPKSVVQQWANGDDGKDKPHLYEVINWVYEKFSKLQITGMWVAGHSWGAMFAKTFVCDEMLKERVRGVIGMSGGATGVGGGGLGGFLGGAAAGGGSAGCADRISQIHTVGDAEAGPTGGLPDQTANATKHGCDAKTAPKDIGNAQMLTEWPSCDPGWAHLGFTMGAHEHTTPLNPEVVKHIVEQIKATEKR